MDGWKSIKNIVDGCRGPEGMIQSLIDRTEHVERVIARKPGPVRPGSKWVMDKDGYVHPRDPRYRHYEIHPSSFNTPERAKHFARHLSTKIWVDDQSLMDFLNLAATIYTKPSGTKSRTKGKRRARVLSKAH